MSHEAAFFVYVIAGLFFALVIGMRHEWKKNPEGEGI